MYGSRLSALAVYLFISVANFGLVSPWTCDSSRNVTLTKPMLDHLSGRIRSKIFSLVRTDPDGKQFYALVPGFVRLAFHSCSANWCSSRIDFSDPANNGLQDAVAAADQLHAAVQSDPTYTGFSKADLYALCGVVAMEVATQNKTRVKFRYGRPDFCPPDDPAKLNQRLPNLLMGTDETFAFMKSVFGFSPEDTVTILGAHCLGTAKNFLSPPVPVARWVGSAADNFTNEYYISMLDSRWHQVDFFAAGLPVLTRLWVIDELPTRIMFNTDLGMVRRIDANASDGVSACNTSLSCPLAPTAETVYKYAARKRAFFKKFDAVFEIMIENGLRDQLVDVSAH